MKNELNINNKQKIKMKNKNELTLLENIKSIDVFSAGGSDSLLEKIKKKADEFEPDITSETGRKKIKSFAYEIARSKTTLDDMGKSLVSDWKEKAKLVDAERKKIREFFDALKEEVKKPLTDFENAEKERSDLRKNRIAQMEEIRSRNSVNANTCSARLCELKDIFEGVETPKMDWQEFEYKAQTVYDKVKTYLEESLVRFLIIEKEQEELRQLREEKAEQEQKDRDEKIAREAAEKAKREAEEKAESEKQELEAKKKAAEEAKIASENRAIEAEKLAKERAEQVEKDKVEAEKKAKEDAKLAAEQAVKEERERSEAKKAAEDAASAKIAANMEHRDKINREIEDAILAKMNNRYLGYVDLPTKAIAEVITKTISEGNIPHLSIKY